VKLVLATHPEGARNCLATNNYSLCKLARGAHEPCSMGVEVSRNTWTRQVQNVSWKDNYARSCCPSLRHQST